MSRTGEGAALALALALGFALAFGAAPLAGCRAGGGGGTQNATIVTAADLDREIFTSSCAFASCHGGGAPAAGLDFSRGVCAAMLERSSCLFPDQTLVVAADPARSFLVQKLVGDGLPPKPATGCGTSDFRMPLGGTPLGAAQIDRVRSWIAGGAPCGGDGGPGDDGPATDGGEAVGLRPSDGAADAGPSVVAETLALAPPALRLTAGQRLTVTLLVQPPAGPGGVTVVVDATDRDALAVPAAVFAPAGAAAVTFDVIGKRPASGLRLTASLGDASAAAAVVIDGLYIGELFYGGGAHAQWVKLVNASSVPVDLGSYVLGAGNARYGETVAALAGLVEAGRCSVVGGPDSTPDNGSPAYDQVLDFSPDIPSPTPGQPEVGVALFAAPTDASADPTAAIPIDAVVVGPDNAAGLLGPDGMPAVPLASSVAAGRSLARQARETWIVRATPDPADCPTLE